MTEMHGNSTFTELAVQVALNRFTEAEKVKIREMQRGNHNGDTFWRLHRYKKINENDFKPSPSLLKNGTGTRRLEETEVELTPYQKQLVE